MKNSIQIISFSLVTIISVTYLTDACSTSPTFVLVQELNKFSVSAHEDLSIFGKQIWDVSERALVRNMLYVPKLRTLDISFDKKGVVNVQSFDLNLKYVPNFERESRSSEDVQVYVDLKPYGIRDISVSRDTDAHQAFARKLELETCRVHQTYSMYQATKISVKE